MVSQSFDEIVRQSSERSLVCYSAILLSECSANRCAGERDSCGYGTKRVDAQLGSKRLASK